MEFKKNRNSIVILASQHNPTVLLGSFLIDSGMIESIDEVKKDSTIITPAFAQIVFKNADTIQLEPEKLKIEGKFGESAFKKGISYLKALPHITCKAVGINFRYRIDNFDFNKLFNWNNKEKYLPIGFNITTKHDKGQCNVSAKLNDKNKFIEVNFNFDYRFKNGKKFNDLSLDLLEERNKNIKYSEEIIHEIFS